MKLVYSPKLVDVDFSVFKNTQFTERFIVQFRAEFFNIFNHVNYHAPVDNNTLGSSSSGFIDSTTTTSRQIQLGLKIIFWGMKRKAGPKPQRRAFALHWLLRWCGDQSKQDPRVVQQRALGLAAKPACRNKETA